MIPQPVQQLLEELLHRAYAPYSNYAVACVLEGASGALYSGVNVENAAYPLGRCAEQAAVLGMVTAGERDIAKVWVMSRGAQPATPCGGCRQILAEFAYPQVPIVCISDQGAQVVTSLGELLPYAFSGKLLNS